MSGNGKSEISRREFVKAGSAAAVGAPVAVRLAGRAFGSQGSNEIRCAVVGTGGRGRDAHIKSILNVPGARVVAICDPSQKALEAALAMFPGEKPATYTHHRELLDRESLDAVFIASPPVPHREQIVETLQKNLHCYAEKPVVLTVSDVEEVEREAKKSKGILQVGQQLRYSTASRKIARMIHDGEIGRIGFVRAQRMSSWYGPGTEEPVMRWLWSVEESGDQLVEQSIHNIDQINWVLDSHPVKCTGLGGQNMVYEPKGRDTSDHFTVVYEYPGRRIVTFTMIKYATPELGGSFTHFYGEKGACDLQGHRFVGRERGRPAAGRRGARGRGRDPARDRRLLPVHPGGKAAALRDRDREDRAPHGAARPEGLLRGAGGDVGGSPARGRADPAGRRSIRDFRVTGTSRRRWRVDRRDVGY